MMGSRLVVFNRYGDLYLKMKRAATRSMNSCGMAVTPMAIWLPQARTSGF